MKIAMSHSQQGLEKTDSEITFGTDQVYQITPF